MKKTTFLLLLVVSSYSIGQCECGTDKVISIDFNSINPKDGVIDLFHGKTVSDTCYFEHDEEYLLEITNINQNVFNVESKVEFEKFNEEKPEVLKSFKLPPFIEFEIPKDSSGAGGPSILPEDYISKLILFSKKMNGLSAMQAAIDAYSVDCSLSYSDIVSKLTTAYSKHIDSATAEPEIEAFIFEDVIPLLNFLIENEEEFYDKINYEVNQKSIEITAQNRKLEGEQNPEEKEKIKKVIEVFEKSKKEWETLKEKGDKYISSIKDKELYPSLYGIVNKRKSINESLFNYKYRFKTKQDLTKLELTISSYKDVTCDFPKKITLKEERWNKGGLKIDFSSGAIINSGLGNADFIGREYEYTPSDEGIRQIREKDFKKRGLLSLGAFMHIYKRTNKTNKIAFSPGLSVNDDFDGLIYHIGISGIFGKDSRLVTTAGISLKSSEILDGNYEVGVDYDMEDLPENVSISSVFPRLGFFFALSYNLSKND